MNKQKTPLLCSKEYLSSFNFLLTNFILRAFDFFFYNGRPLIDTHLFFFKGDFLKFIIFTFLPSRVYFLINVL